MSLADMIAGGSWELTLRWINDRYLSPFSDEHRRIEDMRERAALYRDDGARYIREIIDKAFDDPDVKRLRDAWVEQAGYNNVTRRVVHELGRLYTRHALRSVDGTSNNLKYQTVLELIGLNEVMLEVHRLAILYRAVWLVPRVAKWNGLPRIDVVEPMHFRLITHPDEPTRIIGSIVDQAVDKPTLPGQERAAYLVTTETERFRMSSRGYLIGAIEPLPFNRIPGVLVALNPPPGRIMDTTTFRDVIRAHKAVWFENVLLLKESKSATRTSVLSGDAARAARKQPLDSEGIVELPDGVTLTPADLSMDLGPFRETADHILERAAANHGIPPQILHHEGATSGYEIELRHVGIRERRIEQEPVFRAVERELADVLSMVIAHDAPHLSFSTEGWSINFGDSQMPRSPAEDLQIYDAEQSAMLTSIIEKEMQRDPDLTRDDAWQRIEQRIEDKIKLAELTRPLQAIDGSAGANPEQAEGKEGKPVDSPDQWAWLDEVIRGAV